MNYTATENRTIRTLKSQGWTNREIAEEMGRTEIGISRHWSNINKNKKTIKRRMNVEDKILISNTMRETCAELGFKKPFVNFYDDTRIGNGYGFKVHGGYKWPAKVWHHCLKAVEKLGYDCELCSTMNYNDNTEAHSRGIRVWA